MKINISFLIDGALALAGCGQSGDEFLGTWTRSKQSKSTKTIERNADTFIVRREVPTYIGAPKKDSYPATFENGMLHMNVRIGVIDFAIDKSSGHLVGGGAEFVRKN